jgi:hypothetical protein
MVSNVLRMTTEELEAELARIRDECGDDPEYQALRAQFPPDWPM